MPRWKRSSYVGLRPPVETSCTALLASFRGTIAAGTLAAKLQVHRRLTVRCIHLPLHVTEGPQCSLDSHSGECSDDTLYSDTAVADQRHVVSEVDGYSSGTASTLS